MEPVKLVVLSSKFGSSPLASWQRGLFFLSVQVAMCFLLGDPCSYTHKKHTTLSQPGFHSPVQSCTEAQSGDYSGSGEVGWGGVVWRCTHRVFNECHYILMKPIGCAQNGHKPLWSPPSLTMRDDSTWPRGTAACRISTAPALQGHARGDGRR